MKASFYFLIWILIYRVIDLFNLPDNGNYSFIVAFVIVYLLSFLINRMIPSIIRYDNMTRNINILEDAYKGDVPSFRKRLGRQAVIETVTAIYFAITLVVLMWVIFVTRQYDIFALIIFAFLAVGAIGQSSRLIKANSRLNANPTPEECARITIDTYKMDYEGFYNAHKGRTVSEMMPPCPSHYNIFLVVSLVIALATALLGLIIIITSLVSFFGTDVRNFGSTAVTAMYFLYGSLATYFGVRDVISAITALKNYKTLKK